MGEGEDWIKNRKRPFDLSVVRRVQSRGSVTGCPSTSALRAYAQDERRGLAADVTNARRPKGEWGRSSVVKDSMTRDVRHELRAANAKPRVVSGCPSTSALRVYAQDERLD